MTNHRRRRHTGAESAAKIKNFPDRPNFCEKFPPL
jgi:hypothetical protein